MGKKTNVPPTRFINRRPMPFPGMHVKNLDESRTDLPPDTFSASGDSSHTKRYTRQVVTFRDFASFMGLLDQRGSDPVDFATKHWHSMNRSVLAKVLHSIFYYGGSYTNFDPGTVPLFSSASYMSDHYSYNMPMNYVKTYEDAMELATYGWPEGRMEAEGIQASVVDSLRDLIHQPQPSIELRGKRVNMARYTTGHPKHMIAMPLNQRVGMGVTFNVSIDNRCNACERKMCGFQPVDPHSRLIRGVIIAQVAKTLANMGYKIGINLVTSSYYYRRWPNGNDLVRHMVIPLQGIAQPFDYDRVVFGVSHDGMATRLAFRAEEILNLDQLGTDFGGQVGAHNEKVRAYMDVGSLPMDHAMTYDITPPELRHDPVEWSRHGYGLFIGSTAHVTDASGDDDAAGPDMSDPRQAALELVKKLDEIGVELSA